jgi:hypothetical protein
LKNSLGRFLKGTYSGEPAFTTKPYAIIQTVRQTPTLKIDKILSGVVARFGIRIFSSKAGGVS